jgi:hypothetical protein
MPDITITLTDQAIIGSISGDTGTTLDGMLRGDGETVDAVAATSSATANTIVQRDANGGFAANFVSKNLTFGDSSAAIFDDGGQAIFNTLGEAAFNDGAQANFVDGSTANFLTGSAANFDNTSEANFLAGSTATFEDGSTITFEEGTEFDIVAGSKGAFRTALGVGTTGGELFQAMTKTEALAALGKVRRQRTTDSAARTTTALANDTEITSIAVLANKLYRFEFTMRFTNAVTEGIVMQLTVPTLSGGGRIMVVNNGGIVTNISTTSSPFTLLNSTIANSANVIFGTGAFRPSVNGNATFQWGKVASGTSNTFILSGSHLDIEEL